MDLKSVYQQIHVSKDLWQYQDVKFNGVHYDLTRLGFGFLTSAPQIMTMKSMILGKVLSLGDEISRATDYYGPGVHLECFLCTRTFVEIWARVKRT